MVHEVMGFISFHHHCMKAEISFWYSEILQQKVAQKKQYRSTSRKCQLLFRRASWEYSQINCALGYGMNAMLCFPFRVQKKTNQHSVRPFFNVFLHSLFMDYFPPHPHQVPSGHLLKWLNPADTDLINILLFVTFQKHQYKSLVSWIKTYCSYRGTQITARCSCSSWQCARNLFHAWLCEKKCVLAVPACWLKPLMTEQWHFSVLLPRPLTHLIGFQCLKDRTIKDVTVSLSARTFRFSTLYYL